jgi:hypothetical protein
MFRSCIVSSTEHLLEFLNCLRATIKIHVPCRPEPDIGVLISSCREPITHLRGNLQKQNISL